MLLSPRRPSLSAAPFRSSLLVLLSLTLFIAIFWTLNEYQSYRQSISNIEQNYKELYQERIQEELENVLKFIDQQRHQAILEIEDKLRLKVQSAYTIASHIYQMHKDTMTNAQLRSMVTETLRPIRWNNGQGYYFTGRITDNTIDLFADDPLLEGYNSLEVRDGQYRTIISDITRIIHEKGAGIYHKKEDDTPHFPGMSFIKHFKPFDWYIGAATSHEIAKTVLQEEILTTMQNMQFSKNGHVICFNSNGTILSHPNSTLIGRSITDLTNRRGENYGKVMLETGLHNTTGSILLYSSFDTFSNKEQQRLSFIKHYSDWNWILLVDISMTAMENAIINEKQSATSTSRKNAFIFLGLLVTAVLFLTSMAYYHSVKIKHDINLFTTFFRKAAHTRVKISHSDSTFSEFEDLAELANTMVDDIVQKEHLLRRDELRLDTLLQLSEMEEYSIRDKYDFVLHRIIQITDSDRGYMALVNHAQTHCTLCSQINISTGSIGLSPDENFPPRLLSDSGLTGNCVLQKKTSIFNSVDELSKPSAYPYKNEVENRMDIPVNEKNTTILVAGVCNSTREYDNSDIRQMTMLLEGMWLHNQKTCSEMEMARLERQVIAVGEEERSKIGRDLHDDLGSHLSGIELLSKVLQQNIEKQLPEHARQLSTIRNLIRDAIEKTRRLSRGLYPVHIIEHGLQAAIEELTTEIEERYPLSCTLNFDKNLEPLANTITPNVYYIVREAMFNAARHGKPQNISITIQRTNDSLSVTIIDDGLGITEQRKKKGLGLHTMQYRAKAIGASLDIQAGKTCGTRVSLSGAGLGDDFKNSYCG